MNVFGDDADDIRIEIEKWESKKESLEKFSLQLTSITSTLLMIASLATIIVAIGFRKRKDCFIVSVPTFFFISALIVIPRNIILMLKAS